MGKNQQAILQLLRAEPDRIFKLEEVAASLGVSSSTIGTALYGLAKKGLVYRPLYGHFRLALSLRAAVVRKGPTCASCRWFDLDGETEMGDCLHDPPRLLVVGDAAQTFRPAVSAASRCHLHALR